MPSLGIEKAVEHVGQFFSGDCRDVIADEIAANAHYGWLIRLEMKVASIAGDKLAQKAINTVLHRSLRYYATRPTSRKHCAQGRSHNLSTKHLLQFRSYAGIVHCHLLSDDTGL